MKETIGVVELDSVRHDMGLSAGKLAARRIGDQNLLTWIVRRMSDASLVDRVVVVSDFSPLPSLPTDVEVFHAPGDPLARLARAAAHFQSFGVLCVRLVHPWIDPDLLDRLVAEAYSDPAADFVGHGHVDHGNGQCLGDGIAWYRSRMLKTADQSFSVEGSREDLARMLVERPGQFQARMLPLPRCLDRADVRLTVECAEDWEHVESIYDALGPELCWQDIADLLNSQPQLRARMATLNRAMAV